MFYSNETGSWKIENCSNYQKHLMDKADVGSVKLLIRSLDYSFNDSED
jgi:hypothetical protein